MFPSTPQPLPAGLLDKQEAQAQLILKDRALAACAEGITIADARLPDQPLIYINAGFERLTGYPVAEVLGRNCRFLQGPETDPATVETLRQAIREQRAVTVELLNYRKDGTPFWNRLSITPVRDEAGVVTHLIGVQSDVTAEVEAKEGLRLANRRLESAARITKQDLEAAAESQQALLPVDLPSFPGFRFAYRSRPCIDVGGDSLNVLSLDDQHLAVYVLDVSGHGVAAALLSVTLTYMLLAPPDRSLLYHAAADGSGAYAVTRPAEVVARLNRQFSPNSPMARYFTMLYGILNKRTGEFCYVAAGHLGPVHVRADAEPLTGETTSIPVGVLAHAAYEERTITLAPGERLYLCTDGLYESENGAQEEFGVERLIEVLDEGRAASLEESLDSLMDRVEKWRGGNGAADDSSILAIERTG
ncbi:MAG: SpoIIE family protein phosphatase [Bryobacteraceae bacterium]|nr:SpoIIE family protein phosphatase [Bryobacteraceae bacterium]